MEGGGKQEGPQRQGPRLDNWTLDIGQWSRTEKNSWEHGTYDKPNHFHYRNRMPSGVLGAGLGPSWGLGGGRDLPDGGMMDQWMEMDGGPLGSTSPRRSRSGSRDRRHHFVTVTTCALVSEHRLVCVVSVVGFVSGKRIAIAMEEEPEAEEHLRNIRVRRQEVRPSTFPATSYIGAWASSQRRPADRDSEDVLPRGLKVLITHFT